MAISGPEKSTEIEARLRFLSLGMIAVALLTWGLNFWPLDDAVDRRGTPLGADYPVFYLAGRMVLDGPIDELYSHEAQQRRLHELFPTLPAGDWLPFRYPPFVALAMTPLAALPYTASWIVFTLLSTAALIVAWRALAGQLPWMQGEWRHLSLLVLLGWPVTCETLLGGQSALFSLAILCGTTALAERRCYKSAGAILALAAFKPNVMALFAFAYVLRYPRLLWGLVPVGLALIVASLATVGPSGCEDYLRLGAQLASQTWDFETDAHKVHGLATWLTPIAHGYERPVLLFGGMILAIAVVMLWRRRGNDRATCTSAAALLISLNLLANPYVPIYDLALLAAGWCFSFAAVYDSTGDGPARQRQLWYCGVSGTLLYFGPHASQLLAVAGEPQLFTPCWIAVTAWQALTFLGRPQPSLAAPVANSPGPSRSSDRFPPLSAGA